MEKKFKISVRSKVRGFYYNSQQQSSLFEHKEAQHPSADNFRTKAYIQQQQKTLLNVNFFEGFSSFVKGFHLYS